MLSTLFEIAMIALLAVCMFNEDKLVAFEEKIFGRSK